MKKYFLLAIASIILFVGIAGFNHQPVSFFRASIALATGPATGERFADELTEKEETRQGSGAGIFNGVSVACFEYGQCTLCDILIVLIEISNIILRVFAVVALLFFMYGSGYLLLSSGNETMITKGKGIIRATIVGSVIVLVAWQLIAIIVTLVANGNAFNKEQQIESINPVANWYNVANRCSNIQAQGQNEQNNGALDRLIR